jgi:hypothetical protein
MNKEMKALVKEAVLEALMEFSNQGVMMTSEGESTGEEGDGEGNTGDNGDGGNTGDNGDSEGDDEGGKKKDPVEPPVIWPPVGV